MSVTYKNRIKKRFYKNKKKASLYESLKLLADFFNGEVINLDEEYKYQS